MALTQAQRGSQKSEVRSAICVGRTDFTLSDKSSVTSLKERELQKELTLDRIDWEHADNDKLLNKMIELCGTD